MTIPVLQLSSSHQRAPQWTRSGFIGNVSAAGILDDRSAFCHKNERRRRMFTHFFGELRKSGRIEAQDCALIGQPADSAKSMANC